jgi:hypothetical protein
MSVTIAASLRNEAFQIVFKNPFALEDALAE